MAVTTGQVNQLYQELLGRSGAEQYLSDWASSGMTIDEIRNAIASSPEGQSYAQAQAATSTTGTNTNVLGQETVGSNDAVQGTIEVLFERHFGRPPTPEETRTFMDQYNLSGDIDAVDAAIVQAAQTNFGETEDGPTTTTTTDPTTTTTGINTNVLGEETAGSNDAVLGTIEVLFERHFGRPPTGAETQSFLAQYNESGDIDAVDAAILQAAQTNFGATEASDGIQAGAELEAMRPVVQGLYQELFGREAGQQGMDYWLAQLRSGATTPDGLRDALISGATGDDLAYYNQNVLNPPPDDSLPDDEGPDQDPPVEESAPDDGTGTTDTTTTDPTTTNTGTPYYTDTPTTDPTTTTTDPTTTTTTGTGVDPYEGTSYEGTGGPLPPDPTPAVNQYQGLFDMLDQRYPNLGGKGGTQQPQAPIISEPEPNPYGQGGGDFYSGGGYYRNPYSSGYGMGYQDPYASQRYMPRYGLLGPTGFGGGKGGVPMSPYGSPYSSPYSSSFGSPYGSSFGSPYGSSFGSPYGSSFGSPYGGSGKGGSLYQPQLPPRDTTGLTPIGGDFLGDGNGLASGINDGTIAMQPGDDIFGGQRIDVRENSYSIGDAVTPLMPGESVPDNVMQQYLMQQERDRLPPQTQGGQQGRLSQAAVLGGMDPASDQMMGAPRPMMMPQPAGMRYRQPMTYGGKGGYYR